MTNKSPQPKPKLQEDNNDKYGSEYLTMDVLDEGDNDTTSIPNDDNLQTSSQSKPNEIQMKTAEDPLDEEILEHLNPILQRWWWKLPGKDKIKNLLGQCTHPKNCEVVKKVRINEQVFQKIGSKGKEDDKTLKYINHSLTRGAQPLVLAWNKIVNRGHCKRCISRPRNGSRCHSPFVRWSWYHHYASS